MWSSCYFLACGYASNLCDFDKSSNYFQMALELSEAANNIAGICFVKGTAAWLNHAYRGKTDLAYKRSKEALDLANQSGDLHSQQMAYSCFGLCCIFKGLFSEAENNLLHAISLHKKTKQVVWGPIAYFWMANIYLNRGDFEKAEHHYNQANFFIENEKILPSWVNMNNTGLMYAKVLQNNKDINLESLFEYAKHNKVKTQEGYILNTIGKILMGLDKTFLPEAEKWINRAIEADNKNNMPWYLGRDFALYAKLFEQKGNQLKAKEALNKAIEIFKECEADGWVEKYELELSALA